jgi:hypothetical protein
VLKASGGRAVPEELTKSYYDCVANQPTPWERDDWVDAFARLTAAFARVASVAGSPARARLPGAPPHDPIPSLEGFARMSVAWGAWLGQPANPSTVRSAVGPVDVLDLVVRGLSDGSDRASPWWWGDIGDRDQRIVEAAEIATGLWLGRDRIAPALGSAKLERLLAWLAGVHGRDVYDDNWVLFPTMVAAVQRGFGQTVPDAWIDRGIDAMLARYRGDGWYADGRGHAFDQYTGWAVHWHLLLWSRIDGDRRPRLRALIERRFRTYLAAVVGTFATDGTRPLHGRSLGYRFAAAAPYGLGALLGIDAVPPGLARRIAGGTIRRHLDDGAIDPATGWFRRGVAGERPDVCERYLSSGAAAWAAHAFVTLGLPPDAPYWSAREGRLPVEDGPVVRPLRGPGLLVVANDLTGETRLVNARADHPDDIPGHDYTPYYGKATYRSAFPFTVRTSAGHPGPDGTTLFLGERDVDHRGLTDSGDVGPWWSWSRYRVSVDGARHGATTVSLLWREVEMRLTGLRPAGPVRLVEAPAALGSANPDEVRRGLTGDVAWAVAGDRSVAVRALVGFDRVRESAPFAAGPDRNLVADHAEQPTAEESAPTRRPRIVGTVGWAGARPEIPFEALDAVRLLSSDGEVAEVALGDTGRCVVALGHGGPRSLSCNGLTATGPGVRLFRVDPGREVGGESIAAIDRVVRLDRPGPIALTRVDEGPSVLAWTEAGLTVDPAWAGFQPRTVAVRGPLGGWSAPCRLERDGHVTPAIVRRLRTVAGWRFLELRLDP